jgi:hypothetical protein
VQVHNHFVLDLLVPFFLEQRAVSCGIGKWQCALRKYWLPYLQASNCYHVIPSLLRRSMATWGDALHRNAFVYHFSSPSLRSFFGANLKLDGVQELYRAR